MISQQPLFHTLFYSCITYQILFHLTTLYLFYLLPSNTSVFAINVGVMEADHMLKLDKTVASGHDDPESSGLPVLR